MRPTAGNLYNMLLPEIKLALLCSKKQNQEKEQAAVNNLITGPINWSLFLHLVMHHRLYPLVYRYLNTLAHPAVPQEVLASLKQKHQENIPRTFQMIAELMRVVRSMDQNGIRAVVMKGFPLAYRLYGDMTLRTSRDLDILIHPKDLDKARKIIEECGYLWKHPMAQATQARLQKWMKTNLNMEYWHPDQEIWLELHWRFNCSRMDMPLSQIESSLTTVEIAGQLMNILGKEELLLSLVLHGAAHEWFRLKWLCDIDIIIRQGEFSWEALYQLADKLGVKPILNQSVILSRDIFATPVPASILAIIKADMKAQHLAVMAFYSIMDNDYNPKNFLARVFLFYRRKKYQFCLKSGWRERVICISRCFLPSEEDLKLISLPERLFFIYYIISPFTWIYHRVRNFLKRMEFIRPI